MSYNKYKQWKFEAISAGLSGFTLDDLYDYMLGIDKFPNMIYIFSELYKKTIKKKRKKRIIGEK